MPESMSLHFIRSVFRSLKSPDYLLSFFCVKKTNSARPFVLRPSVTPRVLPRKPIALLSVKRLRARGRAPNRRPARARNASCSAQNRLAMLKTNVSPLNSPALNSFHHRTNIFCGDLNLIFFFFLRSILTGFVKFIALGDK